MKRAVWTVGGIGAVAAIGAYFLAPTGPGAGGNPGGKKGCEIVVTNPVLEPGGVLTRLSGDSLSVTYQGKALRCPSSTVTIFATVGGGAETQLGTTPTDSAGAWSYAYTATDGVTTVLRAQMTSAAGKVTSTSVSIAADTSKPKVVVTAPAADDWGRVRVVAPAADAGCGGGGNYHADRGEPGWVYDKGCAAGGQVLPQITVTGGSPGTLSAWYADAGLASVPITTSPQTFTAADLGTWTLPDWTRADLIVSAAGPSGTTTKTLMARVATVSPSALRSPDGGVGGPIYTIVNNRGVDVDVAFQLPTPPPEVASATITVAWTTSTSVHSADVSLGTVALTTTPTLLPSPPGTCEGITIATTAAVEAYCAIGNPSPGSDAGVRIPVVAQYGNAGATLDGDAGWSFPNGCGSGATTPPVYCVSPSATNVTVKAVGCCLERTHALFDDSRYSGRAEACQFYDGVWTCADGTTHSPGEPYTVELRRFAAPFNTLYFDAELSW